MEGEENGQKIFIATIDLGLLVQEHTNR